MKPKNANFIDLHIEKIVLGVGALFLAYVVWFYVLAGGHSAELAGRKVPARQIDSTILQDARRLNEKLDGQANEQLQAFKVPDYPQQFAARRDATPTPASDDGSIPADRLAVGPATGIRLPLIGGSSEVSPLPGESPFQPLVIPAPAQIIAKADMGAIDLSQIDVREDYDLIIQAYGQATPLDKQWVSLAASIDLEPVRRLLGEDVEIGKRPIPTSFLDETFAFVDVQVERREVLPDGTFGEVQMVSPMAARPNFRSTLAKVGVSNVTEVIDAVRAKQADLLQPEFYPLRHQFWNPPELSPSGQPVPPAGGQDPAPGESQKIRDLRIALRAAEGRLKAITVLIERAKERGQEPGPALERRLERAMAEVETKSAELQTELDRANIRPEDGPMPEGPGPGLAPRGEQNLAGLRGGALLASGSLEVWAHDLLVEPGKTYQYRLRVLASNPLFARRVPKSQAELADQFLLVGDWSAWTDPVTLPQMQYFFVTSGMSNVGKARVQVWKFYDGQWARAEFRVEPGDTVGGRTTKFELLQPALSAIDPAQPAQPSVEAIDFATSAIVVDLDFSHKLANAKPGLGLQRSTTLMIYTDGQNLDSRTESADVQASSELEKELIQPALDPAPVEPGGP